jgi:anti-anti-sigma regulatory factor
MSSFFRRRLMLYEMKQSGDVWVLTLAGDCTIERAAELRKALLQALDSSAHLVVNPENVTAVDLSFLQLLCSAHRTALRAKRNRALDIAQPDKFRRMAQDAGFFRAIGCRNDGDE